MDEDYSDVPPPAYSSSVVLDRPKMLVVHTAVTAGFSSTMTPPLTPMSPSEGAHGESTQTSLFHNYLRALHDFDPRSSSSEDEDASMLTARLRAGDLILVHCVHANGWADGTVLNTGERAWLPTNYCEGYDHPYVRNLLNAMTQFWDLLGASEDANLSTFVRQDYIRGLIAGVRYLLERADCLHRDVPLVKAHVGVRRMRKGLLADLSSLVQIAKRLQETISEPFAGEVIHVLLDDLISKACKVVTRAVSFLDVWSKETNPKEDDLNWLNLPQGNTASNGAETALRLDTDTDVKQGDALDELPSAVDSALVILDQKTTEEEPELALSPSTASASEDKPLPPIKDKMARMSQIYTPPEGVAVHRLSMIRRDTGNTVSVPVASEQLAKAHDICISHIGAFIGHHLHSRPCSELVATTDRLVRACRNMLVIVDEVCSHDPNNSGPVQKAKSEFESKVEELAKSTKDVFKFSDSPDDEEIMMPDQSSHLITVGTGLIRNTGECVVKTRQLIEQIGDFELKAWVVSSPTLPQNAADAVGAVPPAEPTSSPRDTPSSPPKRVSIEKRMSMEKRLSRKMLPPPPPPPPVPETRLLTNVAEGCIESPIETIDTPISPATIASRQSLPPIIAPLMITRHRSATRVSQSSSGPADSLRDPRPVRSDSISPARKNSIGMSISGSTDTVASSARDSSMTTADSQVSTRATTPDQAKESPKQEPAMMNSFASVSDLHSLVNDDNNDAESALLQKTYANELTLNKDGQVSGGSLPALVEQLTNHDSAPDPVFFTAFFITFRKFCEPRDFAQALIARFDYIGDSKTIGTPVRLRIFNVFKHWLETYWNSDADKDALGEIRYFALHKLKVHLPAAGERLVELTRRITVAYRDGTLTGPMVSGVGKSIMPHGTAESESNVPDPMISKSQLNALRVANGGGAPCQITDFDPLEIARQITMLTMKTFCEIRAEELLSMDWGKSNTKKAKNVRAMCMLNTDLANFVGDTILAPDEAKKRAAVIKHWIKIGTACLELSNYDSVMSIMATINSSVVQRLKRTWELINKKTRARIDELDQVCDMSKNYSALRTRLATPIAPCLPFVGIYLTDLTFVIAGNPKRRELPGSTSESGEVVSVINFDMYMRISKIISTLQNFQVPYKLKTLPEMHTWLEAHLQRMRENHDQLVSDFHRRSLAVEPKIPDSNAARRQQQLQQQQQQQASSSAAADQQQQPQKDDDASSTITASTTTSSSRPKTSNGRSDSVRSDRFDFFLKNSAFSLTRSGSRHDLMTIAEPEEARNTSPKRASGN